MKFSRGNAGIQNISLFQTCFGHVLKALRSWAAKFIKFKQWELSTNWVNRKNISNRSKHFKKDNNTYFYFILFFYMSPYKFFLASALEWLFFFFIKGASLGSTKSTLYLRWNCVKNLHGSSKSGTIRVKTYFWKTCTLCRSKSCTAPRVLCKRKADQYKKVFVRSKVFADPC